MFLLPRPRRELASVLAPTTRRAPLREMAPPRSRRRDQPRASGERRSAATMRRDVPADCFFTFFTACSAPRVLPDALLLLGKDCRCYALHALGSEAERRLVPLHARLEHVRVRLLERRHVPPVV